MEHNNYIEFLQGTIEGYPTKVKKHLNKIFFNSGIAQDTPQTTIDNVIEPSINVQDLELTEKLFACIKQHEKAIILFEEWEYDKDYKYSTLFTSATFDQLVEKVKSNGEYKLSVNEKSESSRMFQGLQSPLVQTHQELMILKFNLKFAAVDPLTTKELLLKYPVLAVFHTEEKLIEFRFDGLKRVYMPEKREQTFYSDLIKDILTYFSTKLDCQLHPLELDFLITEAKKTTQTAVRLMAQYMKLPSGGNAQLEVGNNLNYILPIIGELKELIDNNLLELEKTPSFKNALDQFIFENEELSDYSWVEIMWENEIKTRSIRVKFIFNYRNYPYCLLQHYYNNVLIGMERMNHVTRYISNHRGDDTRENLT